MDANRIAVLVGSLRRESYTRKIALALIGLAPASLQMELVEIGQLPLYNQDPDDEGAPPPQWTAFRDRMRPMQGVLFATPEYNRSVPGVLKNAIDVGSRPHGKSVWSARPCAVVSVSPGAIGGFGANHHLRQSLVFLGMPALQKEAYIGGVDKLLDAGGNLSKTETREFLTAFMRDFAAWVQLNSNAAPLDGLEAPASSAPEARADQRTILRHANSRTVTVQQSGWIYLMRCSLAEPSRRKP